MKYPTSSGWYELNDTTEYNGGAVRLKPSYTTTPEFKAKLDFHRSEVLKDIRRNGGQVSHQPWTQEQAEKWAMESDVVRYATFEDDAIEGFKAGMAKAAAEFERIVAELKEKLEVFRNREYGFENELELKQTIARQSRVIEKLKVINRDFAWHYDECSSIVEDNAPCDCGLRKTRTEIATIEKGKA